MRKPVLIVLSAVCFVLGIVGLLIPIVPQVPFLAAGVLLLAAASVRFREKVLGSALYRKYAKPYVDRHPRLSDLLNKEE